MTEIETRTYIKELASKPAFWIKDAKGGYFDIESFGLALIEVFTKSVIKDYKESLVPVAFHIGNEDGSYSRIGATYNNESTAKNHIVSYKGELVACIVPLYALGKTK